MKFLNIIRINWILSILHNITIWFKFVFIFYFLYSIFEKIFLSIWRHTQFAHAFFFILKFLQQFWNELKLLFLTYFVHIFDILYIHKTRVNKINFFAMITNFQFFLYLINIFLHEIVILFYRYVFNFFKFHDHIFKL